jgi:hypothetical protein
MHKFTDKKQRVYAKRVTMPILVHKGQQNINKYVQHLSALAKAIYGKFFHRNEECYLLNCDVA